MTRIILLCAGLYVAGAAGAVCVAQTAPQTAAAEAALDQVRIDVVDEMLPMAEAVKQVERRFGRVVTYEDVFHVAPTDVVDITDQVAKVNPQATHVLVPRRESIRLAYTSHYATLDDQAGEALGQLLAVWNGGDHSGKFRVERVAGGYHVIPVGSSALDTRITVPTAERDGLETLTVLAHAVAEASGRRVGLARGPTNFLARTRVTIGATQQPAREVLWRAVQAIDPALSWQLTCGAGDDAWCFISIHVIGR